MRSPEEQVSAEMEDAYGYPPGKEALAHSVPVKWCRRGMVEALRWARSICHCEMPDGECIQCEQVKAKLAELEQADE